MENKYNATNIHLEWLDNILKQIKELQNIERNAREGCNNLMEYLELPIDSQKIILPDIRYKNLRFFVLELDILIDNLSSYLEEKYSLYKKRLKPVVDVIDKRNLFLKEKKVNNNLVSIRILPLFDDTLKYLLSIKSNLIKDIGGLLYIKEEDKKTW